MNSQKTCCLKCHRCCETLACSVQGCPIVIHESCMPCAAHFDNTGNFYCPYCLFKQSLLECHQAKEKALLAKKALAGFLATKNDAVHLKNSNTLKRKRPEAPTIVQKRNDAGYLKVDCNNAHQRMQVEHGQQNDNQFIKTLSGNQQQAGQTKGNCLVKGSVAKDDRDLTKSCLVSVDVEGYKIGRQEDVQTQADLRIEHSKKEIQGETVNKGGCSRSAYENMFKVKSPKTDVFPSREETTKAVEGYYDKGVVKVQMQTDPPETSWCMKNEETLETSKESDMRNAFQDCETINEGERKAIHVVHHRRNDEKSFPGGKSEKSSQKDPEIEQALEKFCNKAMEMAQTHEEPKKISVFCKREDNANVVIDKPDQIKDSAYQNECSIKGKEMVDLEMTIFMAKQNSTAVTNEPDKMKDSGSRDDYFPRNDRVEISGNANQPDDVGKNCYGSAKGITQRNTLQDPVHPTKDDNVAVTHELKRLTKQHPVTKNELERCHNGMAQNELTELRSSRYDDKQELVEKLDAEICNSFPDECIIKNCDTVMGKKDVDQTAGIGEDCCGRRRTIEEKAWVKIVKNAPQGTKNESATVSYEEFGYVDDSESCTKNSEYLAYGVHAVEKRQIKKKLKNGVHIGESSVCSENEVEEFGNFTLDKPRHKVKSIKQIQCSTILPAARRKKLPWTAQEIEMLKEGVQKFSMTTNKNLPWVKILEFGLHIFDGTRTPVDLKDKWKNMKGKGNTHCDAK